jgi:serine/threonine protein phosphatase 1
VSNESAETPTTVRDEMTRRLFQPGPQWGDIPALTDADFSAEVAQHHLRFDADQYENIYVVGDVHGCIAELRTLWERLSPTEEDIVVFVGDLVRKGPDSAAVVKFVQSKDNAVSVRGNNEAKIIHDRIDTDPFDPVADALESFPLVVSWEDAMAVHGGVNPTEPLSAHEANDLLEMRSVPPGNSYDGPFWFERHDGPPRVFFGHTVLADPFVSDWAIGLDTGCVYGGSLTAYDYRRDELISVPAEQTYQSRPDEKILKV